MNEILERHARRLTSAERQAVWEAISGARSHGARALLPRALATSAIAIAALALAVSLLPHGRVATPVSVPPVAALPGTPRAPAAVVEPSPARVPPRVTASAPVTRRPAAGAIAARVSTTPADRDTSGTSAAATPAAGGTGILAGRLTDAQGQAIAYANVLLPGAKLGAASDETGHFRVAGIPAGVHLVKVMATGYAPVVKQVRIERGEATLQDVQLGNPSVMKAVEEIAVGAERRLDTKSSSTRRTISAQALREIPVDNLQQSVAGKAGIVAQGDALHFRGGRGGEVKYQFDGISAAPTTPPHTAPPVVPTTGGTALPNDEAFDSMFFRDYGVNPFIAADEDPLSTFALDVDAGSYTLMRRYIGLGQLPPRDAVRMEEYVNFFPQGYPHFEDDDFRILVDGAPSPFGAGYQLLRVGLKAREIPDHARKPARLTFVIDVSGSMGREDRLGLVKRSLSILVDRLRADDRIGIVVFGTTGRVLLEPTALGGGRDRDDDAPGAGGRQRILDAIDALAPEGSTNTEEGLRLGYDMAGRQYREGANNRIVLCSDGVANVGATGPESILSRVRTEADRGIALTTIGFGMGNYNDVLMEQLADKGDGNHYYVDDLAEARRVFVDHLTGTLQTVAKDAKVQVEFDSTRVLRYRLIGFENRDVADRDFRNDTVDAGEIGAEHEVTALYEVKLAPHAGAGTLATVRLRWTHPGSGGAPAVREIAQRFETSRLARRFEDASPWLRRDAAVAEYAEILRGSYWAKDGRLADVLSVARRAADDIGDEPGREFVRLVGKAADLRARAPGVEMPAR